MTSVLWTTVKPPYSPDLLMVRNGSLLPNPKKSLASKLRAPNLSLRTSLFAITSSAVIMIVCFLFWAERPAPTNNIVNALVLLVLVLTVEELMRQNQLLEKGYWDKSR